jgi:glyoxylase-like metal-dependent hydrolase (beta-lactamase superfamily II)
MAVLVPGSEELVPGLHRWEAFHPSWGKVVACVALVAEDGLVLVDPLAPPDVREARRFWKALDARAASDLGRTHVVLTLHYHLRSAPDVAARYGAPLWVPAGSEHRVREARVDNVFAPGDDLPGGLRALDSGRSGEVVLWSPRHGAAITGDVVLGGVRRPLRVCPASWLPPGVTRGDVARALAPLHELPIAIVVPLHGPPVRESARAALAAALAEAAA